MTLIRSAFAAVILLAASACVATGDDPSSVIKAGNQSASCSAPAARVPSGVPLETMVGQLLVVGFEGSSPGSASAAAVRDDLAAGRVGGVLFLRHNVSTAANVKALAAGFIEAAGSTPPLLMIDQEGGAVARLTPSMGFPATPSAETVAQRYSPGEAEAVYRKMADGLRAWGFNVNLAPIADVEVNPSNPVIAKPNRAYSSDPQVVAAYNRAFLSAHRAAGVAGTLKHFPGHGSSAGDSHNGAVDVSATWSEAELIPYRTLIDARAVDVIMVGHLRLDRPGATDTLPASISPSLIQGLLRDELCFSGVVVTDDLIMRAIRNRMSAIDAVVAALKAGNDIAVVSGDASTGPDFPQKAIAAVVSAAEQDPAFRRSLEMSYARVMDLKRRFGAPKGL
ncbi:glycoside hydrolase family 3 N-terminal domain-containing protein [Amorphus orientalis]|uniref:beta-N-acetylhexosaminidase n=1 Tax=Amorphus orientalis TaxID=649198 RepID=A0AAE3VM46_9HYPH|nr:glycoside hydrolase family 3 N-terminal domain-containing protein [Amorphus orientalis]MDQ0314211.1 beta-N-acetylhexosaminidase [Amorphus orientalis]